MRRKLTPELYRALVKRHLPRGWRICERDEANVVDRGSCSYKNKRIDVPFLLDRNALFVAFHECGHARIHRGSDMALHVEEYEAEQFAIALMRIEGIPVPRDEIRHAKENVRGKILRDVESGYEIDADIQRWAAK